MTYAELEVAAPPLADSEKSVAWHEVEECTLTACGGDCDQSQGYWEDSRPGDACIIGSQAKCCRYMTYAETALADSEKSVAWHEVEECTLTECGGDCDQSQGY